MIGRPKVNVKKISTTKNSKRTSTIISMKAAQGERVNKNLKKILMKKLQRNIVCESDDETESTVDESPNASNAEETWDHSSLSVLEHSNKELPSFLDMTSPAYQRIKAKIEGGLSIDAKSIARQHLVRNNGEDVLDPTWG